MSIWPTHSTLFRKSLRHGVAFARDRNGGVAVFAAVVLSMTIGFVGLGAETGYWYVTKKKLQNVADASVYAAAVEVRADKDQTVATTAANAILARVGGLPANKALTVTTFSKSTYSSGPLANKEGAIVVATATVPPMFSNLFRNGNIVISARAAATLSDGASTCILGLQKTGTAVEFSGNGVTRLVGCDVHSNSVASNSLKVWGSSLVTTGCVASSGGMNAGAGLTLTECTKAVTLAPQITDPYAGLAAPPIPSGACINAGNTYNSGNANTQHTIDPGKYCGLALGRKVNMTPGVYVIDGGTFSINATAIVNAVAKGSTPAGIMIYLINGATLSFNGGAVININAQVSGTYAGILFFGDRTGSAVNHTINGNASSTFTGIIYTPNDNVTFTGDGDMLNDPCTLLIANTVTVSGNAKFGSNCTGSGLIMPKTSQVITIVE